VFGSGGCGSEELVMASLFQFPVGTEREDGIRIATKDYGDDDGWYVAQGFGPSTLYNGLYHPGEDWNRDSGRDTDVGEKVYAVADGIVYDIKESVKEGRGGGVVLCHTLPDGSNVYSVYVHITPNKDLKVGEKVNATTVVGEIAKLEGMYAHLHFEIRIKPVIKADWYPNDNGEGYYTSQEAIDKDGFIDPSEFITKSIEDFTKEKQRLKERINRLLLQQMNSTYPPYLWVPTAQSIYDELYNAGVNFDILSQNALIKAERLLMKNDLEGAKKYINIYYDLQLASNACFSAAAEVAEGTYKTIQDVLKVIHSTSDIIAAVLAAVVAVGGAPAAIPIITALFLSTNFVIDYYESGLYEATAKRITGLIVDKFIGEFIGELVDEIHTNHTLPVIQKIVSENKRAVVSNIVKALEEELASESVMITVEKLDRIVNNTIDEIIFGFGRIDTVKLKSPGELRVYDSQGRVTGLVNGEVKNNIPKAVYDVNNEEVLIYYSTDSYIYEVEGTDEGVYGLEVTSLENGTVRKLTVSNIHTSEGAVHHYTIDWDALLSSGGDGGMVTMRIDSDGDGEFERELNLLEQEQEERVGDLRVLIPGLTILVLGSEEEPQPITLDKRLDLRMMGATDTLTIRIENSEISSIQVHMKQQYDNVRMRIERLEERPSSLPAPDGPTLAYYIIETNIPADAIDYAKIGFSVPKTWLTSNNISEESVRLLRFVVDRWEELSTEIVSDDATDVRYIARTPGFSYFAIGSSGSSGGGEQTYNLELYEGSNPSDGVINLGEDITAKATTNDSSVVNVKFRWIDPSNNEVRNTTVNIVDGEASDTYTPNQVGTWKVVAEFSNGTIVVKELYVPFQVVPESIIGALSIIGSSLAVLAVYRRRRKVNNN
jgi:PGF-pre-PGF domain-containing protein